jgi:DNA-directed RNA polymerase specialized sigma24 family protein
MRLDSDFAAYLVARWPALVRMLVLLGGRPAEAEDAVGAGLARAYADWAPISGSDDPDVHVYRSVLAAWARRSGRWWEAPPDGAGGPDGSDGRAGEPAPELAALERQLDRLTGDERLALVLRFAAGLDERQVAAVLNTAPAAVRELLARALARVDLTALRRVDR